MIIFHQYYYNMVLSLYWQPFFLSAILVDVDPQKVLKILWEQIGKFNQSQKENRETWSNAMDFRGNYCTQIVSFNNCFLLGGWQIIMLLDQTGKGHFNFVNYLPVHSHVQCTLLESAPCIPSG